MVKEIKFLTAFCVKRYKNRLQPRLMFFYSLNLFRMKKTVLHLRFGKAQTVFKMKKPLITQGFPRLYSFHSLLMAGAEGLEPSARGFGDRCSTN